jgi:hypothetical protein
MLPFGQILLTCLVSIGYAKTFGILVVASIVHTLPIFWQGATVTLRAVAYVERRMSLVYTLN